MMKTTYKRTPTPPVTHNGVTMDIDNAASQSALLYGGKAVECSSAFDKAEPHSEEQIEAAINVHRVMCALIGAGGLIGEIVAYSSCLPYITEPAVREKVSAELDSHMKRLQVIINASQGTPIN